jgi:hypothetical protein
MPKGKKAKGKVKGKIPLKRMLNEDKVRHIEDNREGRAGFSLCGCVMHKEWGRTPLDPLEELDLGADDAIEYMINALHGCQKCLKSWIKRFL